MLPTYLLLLVVLFVLLHYYFNIVLLQFISILHFKKHEILAMGCTAHNTGSIKIYLIYIYIYIYIHTHTQYIYLCISRNLEFMCKINDLPFIKFDFNHAETQIHFLDKNKKIYENTFNNTIQKINRASILSPSKIRAP